MKPKTSNKGKSGGREITSSPVEVLNWLDCLSKIYAKYEQQPSSFNLSMLLGYISSIRVVKEFLITATKLPITKKVNKKK